MITQHTQGPLPLTGSLTGKDPADMSAVELQALVYALRDQRDELLAALNRIAKWNEHTTEFAVDFGSNGVRDFYRGIASRAIRAIANVKGGVV